MLRLNKIKQISSIQYSCSHQEINGPYKFPEVQATGFQNCLAYQGIQFRKGLGTQTTELRHNIEKYTWQGFLLVTMLHFRELIFSFMSQLTRETVIYGLSSDVNISFTQKTSCLICLI